MAREKVNQWNVASTRRFLPSLLPSPPTEFFSEGVKVGTVCAKASNKSSSAGERAPSVEVGGQHGKGKSWVRDEEMVPWRGTSPPPLPPMLLRVGLQMLVVPLLLLALMLRLASSPSSVLTPRENKEMEEAEEVTEDMGKDSSWGLEGCTAVDLQGESNPRPVATT